MGKKVDPIKRFWSKIKKTRRCWIWVGALSPRPNGGTGYGVLWVDGQNRYAHRFAFELLVGRIPDGLCVCHKCDYPPCVRPAHLFLGTNADNIRDASKKGRLVSGDRAWQRRNPERVIRGEHHRGAKLTDQQVSQIRSHTSGRHGWKTMLARKYHVGVSTISRILKGEQRAVVECP